MCEKYSEYAQICANNERKYANMREILAPATSVNRLGAVLQNRYSRTAMSNRQTQLC